MSPFRILILVVSCLCFIFCAIVLMNLQTPRSVIGRPNPTVHDAVLLSHGTGVASVNRRKPEALANAAASSPTPTNMSPAVAASATLEADLLSLRAKNLLIPVSGVSGGNLRDTFNDARSEGRIHQALDIMAPSGTPVVAVADGTATRLHTSDRGGLMVYQMDSSSPYVYYYAHLQKYAEGIYEGKPVKRGEVIAYVGDTGNAGAGNYHLHFGISKVSAPGKWSGGEPINPYSLLTER